tara:strand:- start:5865 stop:6707 length:843 start_codon:yes stop_codon:yes gene_type:complete
VVFLVLVNKGEVEKMYEQRYKQLALAAEEGSAYEQSRANRNKDKANLNSLMNQTRGTTQKVIDEISNPKQNVQVGLEEDLMQRYNEAFNDTQVASTDANEAFKLGVVDNQVLPKEVSLGENSPLKPFRLKIQKLKENSEFMSELTNLKEEFPGLTDNDIFLAAAKESSLNPRAVNSLGYKGLFQVGKAAAKDSGINYENFEKLSAGKQLKEFAKYLRFNKFDPNKHTLGLILAAPSYKNSSPNTVVYKEGSRAANKNPGWVDSKTGNVTVASINNYYRGN